MAQVQSESKYFPWGALHEFAYKLLISSGLPNGHADLVADTLIQANLRGIDSHGIARLPHYLRRIKHGSIKPDPRIAIQRVSDACSIIDGDDGLGQIVMSRATNEAIDLARRTGAGWAAVRHSSHCGALAYYGLRIAEQGLIGLVFTHVDPMVLPHGAREPFCGTNPICIAIAGEGDDHLCLDMATSLVPWNTIANAATENLTIPEGWAVDADGCDTTDAKRVAALYPFGSYKGSGLGLMIDMLCSLLSETPYGPDIPKMYGNPAERRKLGGLVGAIDIQKFTQVTGVQHRVTELIRRWTGLAPMHVDGRVLYPGQPEVETKRQRLESGIPIGLELLKSFHQLAAAHRIEPLEEVPAV